MELDKLKPEVRGAFVVLARAGIKNDALWAEAFNTIHAELLRLAEFESELAALKARIAEAPLIVLTSRDHPAADPRLPEYEGKPVRLLLDDGESA